MEMQQLDIILSQIDAGALVLPRFQRGYVWRGSDVSELMLSLYKGYPVGHFLVWQTQATKDLIRGNQELAAGMHKLLLDGQQRVTSLYGIIRGEKPKFLDGDERAFRDLYFNVEEEAFEFYSSKMKYDPLWVSVTELMQPGMNLFEFVNRFESDMRNEYGSRLERITKLRQKTFFVETVAGRDKSLDDVVNIFNLVNTGGTKLTEGDLALAKISAEYPDARDELRKRLTNWEKHGYKFSMDWLLRCINAIVTGQSEFQFIADVSADAFKDGVNRAEKQIDNVLTLIRARLGLVDSSVLRSHNSIPAMIRYMEKQPSWQASNVSRLLYWYVSTIMWGRYSTSVTSRIRQDLQAIDENDDAIGALVRRLRQTRGHLRVAPADYDVAEARSRIFPILYMLTRVNDVPDFYTGLPLSKSDLGMMGHEGTASYFPQRLSQKSGHLQQVSAKCAGKLYLADQANQPHDWSNTS